MNLDAIRCPYCELRQFAADKCRRCLKPFPSDLPRAPQHVIKSDVPKVPPFNADGTDFPTISEMEKQLFLAAMKRTDGNVTKAARMLGIGRTTLYRNLKEYGISVRMTREVVTAGSDAQ